MTDDHDLPPAHQSHGDKPWSDSGSPFSSPSGSQGYESYQAPTDRRPEPTSGADPTQAYPGGYAPPAPDPSAQNPSGQNPYGQSAHHPQAPAPYGSMPYGAMPYGYGMQTDHSSASTSMVLGLVALIGGFICGVPALLGPVAWYMGHKTRKEIAANPMLGGHDKATAGMVMGIVASVGLILIALVFVAYLVIFASIVSSS